jgi:hypothetical protein
MKTRIGTRDPKATSAGENGRKICPLNHIRPVTKPNLPTNDRPKASRAEIVTAMSHVLIALMACTGVWSLTHGLTVEKKQNAENAIASLYPLDINVNQALAQKPKAQKALWDDHDGIVYRSLSDEDKSVFEEACSSLGAVFEYYLLIRDNIKNHPMGDQIIHSWDAYIEMTCEASFGFRNYINETRKIWSPMFLAEFKKFRTESVEPTIGTSPKP